MKYTDTLIPSMTGDREPSGIVKGSPQWSARYAWKAFNPLNDTVEAGWTSGSANAWIEYEFEESQTIKKYAITSSPNTGSSGSMNGLKWYFQGSNNGVDYVDIHHQDIGIASSEWNNKGRFEFEVENNTLFKIYRIQFINTSYVYIGYIEMMGLTFQQKHLIKLQNNIHMLSKEKNSLVYPNLQEPLVQADYEKWGMDSLVGYENEIDKVRIEMVKDGELEDGRIIRKKLNRDEIKINSLGVR